MFNLPGSATMKLKARRKTVLQALIFTSLFWVSLDVLFYVHKQSPNIDLDVVVINKQNAAKPGRSTTPVKPYHNNVQIKSEKHGTVSIKHQVFDRFPVNLKTELFPELVIHGLGDDGLKAKLPTGLQELSKKLFNNHSFDSVLSDRISMKRKLPDARGKE